MENRQGNGLIPLKVLVLEDSIRDYELVAELLLDTGFEIEVTRVEKESEYLTALKNDSFDIILSDFTLPGFDAFGALQIRNKICPHIPLICVSGSIGEETAIELLKLGAVDYVLKDRPERLPFAIKRALDEAKEKAALLKASKALEESEHRFKQVAEDAQEWIWEIDTKGLITYSSPVIKSILGYDPEEIVDKKFFYDLFPPELMEGLQKTFMELFSTKKPFTNFENPNLHKDGRIRILNSRGSPVFDRNGVFVGFRGVDTDITERKQSEEALRLGEITYRDLFDGMNETVWIMDLNGNIIDVNKTATSVLGYTKEEIINIGLNNIDANYNSAEIKGLVNSIPKEKVRFFESLHKRKDGSTVPVEIYSSLISYKGKLSILSIARDISLRIKAEEQIRLLSHAIDQSSVSINITDSQGNIIYSNPYFTELTGFSAGEVKGKNFFEFKNSIHSTDFYNEILRTLMSGKEWKGEILDKKKNGTLFWEKSVISPIMDNKGVITHFVAIQEDTTEKKKMLEELVAAKEKAEESDNLKTAFINNISHEIRTPLNSILGFGELMTEQGVTQEDRIAMFDHVRNASNRLVATISNFMDMARIVSGTIKVAKTGFIISSFIEDVVRNIGITYPNTNLKILGSVPNEAKDLILYSDNELIRKILSILIDNAIKFTESGSIICGFTKYPKNVNFFVEDSGKGIAPDKLQIIFDMFSQEYTSNNRGYEGSGLGLAIAKGLVKILGGEISVVSQKGKGSRFSFNIPNETPVSNDHSEEIAPISPSPQKKPLILVAEDESSNFLFMELLLKKGGYEYLHALNGLETVELCQQNPDISMVLMDIKMPLMDGIEATRRIRMFRPDLPIIATTAYTLTGDEQRFLAAGCNDYISKPLNREKLMELLNKYS